MENAERDTEINWKERRNILPRVYELRWTQLYGQLWSKAMNLQANAQILRQNAPCRFLYSFSFYGNLWEALIREYLEGERRENPWNS